MTTPHTNPQPKFWTIGHSVHRTEQFLQLLQQHRITLIADVRTHPTSQHNPQFSWKNLQPVLQRHNINYKFHGRALGGKPPEPDLYRHDGRVLYNRVAATNRFRTGLQQLIESTANNRVAVMCSEEDPNICHRYLLITRVAHTRHITAAHIRGDGTVQNTEELTNYRTWDTSNKGQTTMFGETEPVWVSPKPVRRPQP